MKVSNAVESAIIVTNIQTIRDCALHQWNVDNVTTSAVLISMFVMVIGLSRVQFREKSGE